MDTIQRVGMKKGGVLPANRKMERRKLLKQNIPLWLLFIPFLLHYLIFKYIPMAGILVAFKNYNFAEGIFGSPWAGFDNFKMLFSGIRTLEIIKNTLYISVLRIFVGFPFPIICALLINEVRKSWFKRSVQTMVYLPHFLSWVVVSGVVVSIFSQQTGVVNAIIKMLGGETYSFLYHESSWLTILLATGIWKEAGFGSIIYLAALTNIDPQLYEASSLDGAGKFRQMWNITLPGIAPTIALMLILAMGNVMEVGFELMYTMGNDAVSGLSEVISTYIYRVGIQGGQYSLTTAMGLFESLVGLVLVIISNRIARIFNQSLW